MTTMTANIADAFPSVNFGIENSMNSNVFDEEIDIYDLCEDLQRIAKTDLNEDAFLRRKCLKEMRSWIKSNHSIIYSATDANFLLRFLRMKKFDLQRAQDALLGYLKMRHDHPKWFTCLDPEDAKISALVNAGAFFALPEKDHHGRTVIFAVGRNINPKLFTAEDLVRGFLTTCEALLINDEDQIRGFTYVFDCLDVGWSFLSLWTPYSAQMVVTTCETNLPMRHKDVNFLNVPYAFLAIYEFIRSMLTEKMKNRLHLCSNQKKLSKLPRHILPLEYGGNVPMNEMIDSWKTILAHRRQKILDLDKMRLLEEKRNARLWSLSSCLKSLRIV